MKKLFTSVFLFLFIMTSVIGVNAQEVEMRSVDIIVSEIRTNLQLEANAVIDPSLVKVELLEELGDSVMEAYIGNSIMHEQMDEYFGGEGSATLTSLHIQLGGDYLNGYPITMMTFMNYGYNDQTNTNGYYGGMMGRNNTNGSYGMMGRNYDYNNQSNSNDYYGGMMGGRIASNGIDSNYANTNPANGYYGMMNNFSSGGMIMGMLGFLVLIVALVYLFSSNNRNQVFPTSNNAMNILKERYARGEITRDEFIQISSTIK